MNESIQRIMDLVAENKISEHALEIKLGFSQGMIGNWRRGKNKVSSEAIIKLATYFNVSANYLLCLSDEPTPIKTAENNSALPIEFFLLFQDKQFVNLAKLYKELPQKYKDEVYALIRGITIGAGLNSQRILE